MELSWLEDFLELARTGHFSRAAEARHLTQPAFSRRIRALEEWAGVTLFDRTSQPASLTEAGQRFLPLAESLIRQLAEARRLARDAAAAGDATIRLAATHALSQIFFSAWLRRMEADGRGPWVVHLSSDTLAACERLILDAKAEFLLCHVHDAVPPALPEADFRASPVGEDRLVPCVALALAPPMSENPEVRLTETLPLLAYSGQSGLGRILRACLGARLPRLLTAPALVADLAGSLRASCLDGRGVAWLPASLADPDIAAGRLVMVAGEAWRIPVSVCLFRPRAALTPRAEAFWQAARQMAGDPGRA